jgi:hypothetical protein
MKDWASLFIRYLNHSAGEAAAGKELSAFHKEHDGRSVHLEKTSENTQKKKTTNHSN